MKSKRCAECGERIIDGTWEDGKIYCLYCALGIHLRKRIDEVKAGVNSGKDNVGGRK